MKSLIAAAALLGSSVSAYAQTYPYYGSSAPATMGTQQQRPMGLVAPAARRPYSGHYEVIVNGQWSQLKLALDLNEQNGVVAGRADSWGLTQGASQWSHATDYPSSINVTIGADGAFETPVGSYGSKLTRVYWCGPTLCAQAYSAASGQYYNLTFTNGKPAAN